MSRSNLAANPDRALVDRVVRRFEKLHARRGLALPPASRYSRRFAMPVSKTSGKLAYGDLDSSPGVTPDGLPAIDTGTMSAGFVITTARRDRHGDIVEPEGCKDSLADYEKNPQVFFSHRSDQLPIANARDREGKFAFWLEAGRITSRAYFHGKTQESDDVFALLAEGYLRAASIGFVPVEGKLIAAASDEPVDDEGNVDFDLGGILFTKWSLLEWSVVPVPANPDALRARLEATTKRLSASVRKSLEPFASPLRRVFRVSPPNPPRGGDAEGLRPNSPTKRKMPLDDDLIKPPTQKPGRRKEPLATPDGDSEPPEVPQAFVFHTERFPSPQECEAWLAENGFEGVKVTPGEEGDEPHVAILFAADMCEPDTAYREEIEDGVESVCCVKKPGPEDEGKDPNADREEPQPAAQNSPAGPEHRSVKSEVTKGQPGPEMLADEMEESVADDAADRGDDDPGPKKPYGAVVCEAMHGHLKGMHDTLSEAMELVEHPKVLKYVQRMHKAIGQHKEELEDFAAQHYPDHFKPEGDSESDDESEDYSDDDAEAEESDDEGEAEDYAEDEEEEDGMTEDDEESDAMPEDEDDSESEEEDEDEEEEDDIKPPRRKPGGKKPSGVAASYSPRRSSSRRGRKRKAAIARKDLGVLTEASGFLVELASEDNLKKSQKAACKLHAREVDELARKYGTDAQAGDAHTPEKGVESPIAPELLQEYEELRREFYMLTGEGL